MAAALLDAERVPRLVSLIADEVPHGQYDHIFAARRIWRGRQIERSRQERCGIETVACKIRRLRLLKKWLAVGPQHHQPLAKSAVNADELITWCRDRMAGFKVPRSVQFLDELPLNATGKVVKDQLR